ncbi:ABC transporter ATP-binding protein [Kineococcus sp. TBRC 1896]|uniref:ABC transporter ATP-binding protein n=1 Tax=Kineococcus mangrovi TaxID=1660183 RepID=A0ABV4HYK6_9ACTN
MSLPVQLRGVEICFTRRGLPPLLIVQGLDLSVAAGVLHCLAGRSGSGKTSVLRVAAGQLVPRAGTVHWSRRSVLDVPDRELPALRRRSVGYLDQGAHLLPGLSVLENVLVPAVPTRQTRQLRPRALDLLDRLGVRQLATRRTAGLSGGERQRVALARALLLSPAAVLADEPTASLDRTTADGVIDLLRATADRGTAVLVTSHDPGLVDAADERTAFS